MRSSTSSAIFFFFNDTATTEIYTLSLHDALPILDRPRRGERHRHGARGGEVRAAAHARSPEAGDPRLGGDRKSTRLNSSHGYISYAVFCLKKKTLYHRNPMLPPMIDAHEIVNSPA